jgi:hypothetical protein
MVRAPVCKANIFYFRILILICGQMLRRLGSLFCGHLVKCDSEPTSSHTVATHPPPFCLYRLLDPELASVDLQKIIFRMYRQHCDGVLICHLLNNLGPNAVDLKDFSPRPQLSQVCQCFYFVYIYTVYIYLLHVTLMILKS